MMRNKIQLPCGLGKNGKIVYIDEAKNGLKCECVCPGCGRPLVAKNNGEKREHHFAHLTTVECEHGYQSALHYMAKDLFLEMQEFTFVKNGNTEKYKIDSVQLEKKIDNIVPDIILTCDGKQFIVEIFVTHAVDDAKKAKVKEMKISALEIDLSRFRHEMIDKEILKPELSNINNFRWTYDADMDLIESKKAVIQRFGFKIPIGIGNSIACPMLATQKNEFARYVTLDFCKKCPNCCFDETREFIRCAQWLPFPVSVQERQKLVANVFVNESKVMFASEFKKFSDEFMENLQKAVNLQFRILQNISLRLAPRAYPNQRYVQTTRPPRHYSKKGHRRRF